MFFTPPAILGSPAVATTSFTDSFSNTENPLSSSRWLLGLTDGIDWQDVQSTPDKAFAAAFNSNVTFDDCTAIIKPSVFTATANQSVTTTIFKQSGYSPTGDHEVEHRLRGDISGHNNRGYEILWGIQGSSGLGYAALVVWHGPVGAGNFTPLWTTTFGGVSLAADGDTMYSEIVGTVITVKFNGSLIGGSPYDTSGDAVKWASGQPGIGFYALAGATLANYGHKQVTFANL